MQADELRREVEEVAKRRQAATSSMEEVAGDIRRLVAEAPRAGVTISEIARLLGMDRTTLYRTYINGARA